MSIKRYEEHPDGGMREDEDGAYVRYEEHAAILAVGSDLKEIISDLRFYAAKQKWPKGLENMPILLSGAADLLSTPTSQP